LFLQLKENNLDCDTNHKVANNLAVNSNHIINGNGSADEVDDNNVTVIDRMNYEAEQSAKV